LNEYPSAGYVFALEQSRRYCEKDDLQEKKTILFCWSSPSRVHVEFQRKICYLAKDTYDEEELNSMYIEKKRKEEKF
jgi:hypothetical protein